VKQIQASVLVQKDLDKSLSMASHGPIGYGLHGIICLYLIREIEA
jgi:hypothetical protein